MTENVSQDIIADITLKLESVFNGIYLQRMQDVPITNDDIQVRAVSFQSWQNSYLGVMITPWFMNLMLLPGETEDWEDKIELSASNHIFPSGRYEFLVGYEPGIGKYQMCSLFSPMFDFADDTAAVETAEAVVNELMNTENVEEPDINLAEIEGIWNGTEKKQEDIDTENQAETEQADGEITTDVVEDTITESLVEKMEKPLSRRGLLRGALMMDADDR